MRIPLSLPQGIAVDDVALTRDRIPLTIEFDRSRVVGLGQVVRDGAGLAFELDLDASIAVRKRLDQKYVPMSIGFIRKL